VERAMSTAHPNLTTVASARDAFLAHFPTARRSFVCNQFLYAVRRGANVPSLVVASVEAELRRAQQWVRHWDRDDQERYADLTAAIAEHRTEALAFAMWALRWEQLTPEQKARHRAQQSSPHIQAWMQTQPPTEKQRRYLEALGHTGDIESRQHASELIEQLRRRREVAR
jgi:hypothetical protein